MNAVRSSGGSRLHPYDFEGPEVWTLGDDGEAAHVFFGEFVEFQVWFDNDTLVGKIKNHGEAAKETGADCACYCRVTALHGIRLRKSGHGFLDRVGRELKSFQAAEENLGVRIELWVGHGDGFETPRGEAVSFGV